MNRMGYIQGKVMKEVSMDEWSEWQSHHASGHHATQIPCISRYCKSDVRNQKTAMGTVKIHALFTALRKGKDKDGRKMFSMKMEGRTESGDRHSYQILHGPAGEGCFSTFLF